MTADTSRAGRRRAAREAVHAGAADLAPATIPERLLGALGAYAAALDDAEAAGLQIPDLAGVGINNLTIVAKVIEGQQLAGIPDVNDFKARMAAIGLVPDRLT